MGTRVALAAAVLAALATTGCGDDSSQSGGLTMFGASGSITVMGEGNFRGGPCHGKGGYSDMDRGTQVTVYNANDKPTTLGSLGAGVSQGSDCVFPFQFVDIPIQKGSSIYSIEVSHRGKIQFTRDQADSLDFTLGD